MDPDRKHARGDIRGVIKYVDIHEPTTFYGNARSSTDLMTMVIGLAMVMYCWIQRNEKKTPADMF